jgi:hypothetical protein
MKSTTLSILIITTILSCNPSNPNKTTNIQIPEDKLSESVIQQIRQFYKNFQGKLCGSKSNILNNSEAISGNDLVITFKDPLNNKDLKYLSMVSIPIKATNRNDESYNPSFIFGDLNKDGKKDLVVKTYVNGAGTNFQRSYNDLLIFINTNDNLKLTTNSIGDIKSPFPVSEISQISNLQLIGNGYEYAKGDNECCPSLYFKYLLILEKNQLKLLNKTAVH